ncbi:MAG: hypothetical protein WCP62_12585 [Planctomycetota bacterium]
MMPPDPRQIEEWLSGMLDGALSEEEQQQLDIAMQNDPSIAERLEELASLRRSLLRGRSVGRLGAAFPERVVQAARERASQMDAPPAWVLPDAPNAVAPQGQEPLWSEGYSEIDRPVAESVDIPHGASVRGQKAMVRGIMGPGQEHVSVSVRERLVRVWLPSIALVAALCALFVALPRSGPVNPRPTPGLAENPSENLTNSPDDGSPFVLNVAFPGCRGELLLMMLDLAGIACSTGSACSSGTEEPSPVLLAMGYAPGEAGRVLRFSSGWETSEKDWGILFDSIKLAAGELRQPAHS